MKTYIFLYDDVPLLEVMLASSLIQADNETEMIAEKQGNIRICEGMQIAVYERLSEINLEKGDTFILCGGRVQSIEDMDGLKLFLRKISENGIVTGGIGAGAKIVAEALQYPYAGEHTQIFSNQVVLSPKHEYADFAREFDRIAGISEDKEDYSETVRYFRSSQIYKTKSEEVHTSVWNRVVEKVS